VFSDSWWRLSRWEHRSQHRQAAGAAETAAVLKAPVGRLGTAQTPGPLRQGATGTPIRHAIDTAPKDINFTRKSPRQPGGRSLGPPTSLPLVPLEHMLSEVSALWRRCWCVHHKERVLPSPVAPDTAKGCRSAYRSRGRSRRLRRTQQRGSVWSLNKRVHCLTSTNGGQDSCEARPPPESASHALRVAAAMKSPGQRGQPGLSWQKRKRGYSGRLRDGSQRAPNDRQNDHIACGTQREIFEGGSIAPDQIIERHTVL
jgi:hypothetical protein